MSPAFSEVSMHSVIATLSGPEIEYRRPLGMVEPGIRSMAQSYGLCGGSDMALDLLKMVVIGGHRFQVHVRVCGNIERDVVNNRQIVPRVWVVPTVFCIVFPPSL